MNARRSNGHLPLKQKTMTQVMAALLDLEKRGLPGNAVSLGASISRLGPADKT
jgi:hypothetical protein